MALKAPAQLGDNGHGIRPFGYVVEFATPAPGKTFADPKTAKWEERLIQVNSVTLGYGSADQVARLSSMDPKAISADTLSNAPNVLKVPANGECVRVWVVNAKGDRTLAFKGTVRGLHERRSSGGIVWSCEATSEVSRLDETHFTATYNEQDDAIQPAPHFDPNSGALVEARKYTVKEIVEQVLNFKDAWGSTEYFGTADIDWQGLDTDPRCGKFTPSHVAFDNEPKGRAIEEVLQRAGNFTFVYDPAADKLRVVELNADCTKCGKAWDVKFASPEARDIDAESNYAFDYSVKEDATEWTLKDVANVCRITSGPIQYYSGHWIIPERVMGGEKHTVADGSDTVEKQRKRASSNDATYYRFYMPTQHGVHDTRELQRYYVGMPLFPDWNVFEDWFPAVFEVGNVFVPTDWRAGNYTDATPSVKAGFPAPADYKGKAEFQPFCVGDAVARKEVHLGFQDNLRAWQAWYAVDACPACQGQGLVRKVYDNAENEPNLTLVAKGPAGLQRMVAEVTNWIMKPSDFGATEPAKLSDGSTPNPNAGKRLAPPAALVPYYDADGSPPADMDSLTGGYPLPWKHTCPYCRGVGVKPEYKIRNVSSNLFASRNLAVAVNPAGPDKNEIPADVDQTQTGPETWEQAASRISSVEGPMLQVEVPVAYRYVLPTFPNRNLPWTDLDRLADGTNNTANLKRFHFPHPLQFQKVRKALTAIANVKVAANDAQGRDKLVPDSWYCTVPYTTVMTGSPVAPQIDYKLGRVLFPEPQFIPCNKDWATVQVVNQNQARLDATGLLSTHAPARGYTTSDDRGLPTGYWRPARVWMMFCFERDKSYEVPLRGPTAGSLQAAEDVTVGTKKYKARAGVIDGRWSLEVRKLNPDGTEVGDGRPMQVAVGEPNAVIQVWDPDLKRKGVIPIPDATDAQVKAAKATAQYEFPVGKIFKWTRTTPGEQLVQRAGYTDADHFSSLSRPTTFVWTLRDQRTRLLGMAIRRLEFANQVQVSGSLTVVGPVGDLTKGLGYVDYPDKGKAAVKKVTYNFSDGFVAELELHREETRIGELPPDEKHRMNAVEKTIAKLTKTADAIDAARRGGVPQNGNSRNGPIDATGVNLITTPAG